MKCIVENNKCSGCCACANICPKNAITMEKDENGFNYPVIDEKKCINCGLCKKVCPVLNSKEVEHDIDVYACYNKNEEERMLSSSGGIFILLAKQILNKGGVVFGAAFNEDNVVEHIYVDKEEELYKLMGSKYVQSNINDSYKKVKEFLNAGRYVLFTGTPCQIEGLKFYLMKEYDKLFTQDLICHGVPSPLVWEMYKEYRKKEDGNIPTKINFRNKDNGWNKFNMKFDYGDKNDYVSNLNHDLFMKAFLNNLILRDSCFNCCFKKKYRMSDITLADYWGVENTFPEMNDDKGISVVIINSKKGRELFDVLKASVVYKKASIDDIERNNSALTQSVKKNFKREKFFQKIKANPNIMQKLILKYTKAPFYVKFYRKSKYIISKIINILK